MRRVGLGSVFSVLLNLFFFFWLVNTYVDDQYFQAYVNVTISQIYPFIVLTIGVGGGSGIGYFLLRRKHSDQSLGARLQKGRPFKTVSPIANPSTSAQSKILPAGAPPTPASRHTAYAVPPLPKSSTPGGSRTVPSTSWSTGAKSPSLESLLSQKQESPVNTPPSIPQLSTTPWSPSESMGRPGPPPPWRPESATSGERKPDSGPIFQKPGLDLGSRRESPTPGQSGSQPQGSHQPAPPPGSKWQPPEQKTGPVQWTENVAKTPPPVPSKWGPPGGLPGSQAQTQPPLGVPPRPGGLPPRPPFPQSPGGPRPFVYQGPGRPGDTGPVAVPRPFRPEQNRPPPGMGPQPRPPQPMARPTAPLTGPVPQPWTPHTQPSEKKDAASLGSQEKSSSTATSPPSASKSALDQTNLEGKGSGEMDWDTALDTILKTLRKDRVGDRQ